MKRNNLLVFLVDDDKMFLKSMEHHLQHILKNDIKVKPFSSGEDCLKNIYQKPDIVVLDYYLNGKYPDAMNGMEILQKIKKNKTDTAVIMLSAQDKMSVAIDSMKYGAYDYVVKNENTFLKIQNTIKNAINSISITRELRNYKMWKKIILFIIGLILVGAIVAQLFFREFF